MSINITLLIFVLIIAIFLNSIRKEKEENQKDESDKELKDPNEFAIPDEENHLDYEYIKEAINTSKEEKNDLSCNSKLDSNLKSFYEEMLERNIEEIIEFYNTHKYLSFEDREMIQHVLRIKGAHEWLLRSIKMNFPIISRRVYGFDENDIEAWR